MFKLKRILNKTSNSYEVEFFPSMDPVPITKGMIYRLADGFLTSENMTMMPDCPLFYALGNAAEEDSYTEVPCVRITDDMVFEADYSGIISKGMEVCLLYENSYAGYEKVTTIPDTETKADAYVLDNDRSKNKLLITFYAK